MARNTTKMTSRYYVTGRVQGVGYRHWVVQRARALELIGWVRNRRDGRVEVVAYGEKDVLDTLERDLSGGPPAADVTGVERSEERRVGKECVRTCRSRWSAYH